MAEPMMRAAYLQENLTAVVGLGEDVGARVRQNLPEGLASRIERALRTDWLPLADDVALTRAIVAVVGIKGLREVNRLAVRRSFEGPLLAPIVKGAVTLFGATPMALIRMAPRSFHHIHRDAGDWQVDAIDHGATLVWSDLPESIRALPVYLEGTCGTLEGGCAVVGFVGESSVVIDDGRAVFTTRWRR